MKSLADKKFECIWSLFWVQREHGKPVVLDGNPNPPPFKVDKEADWWEDWERFHDDYYKNNPVGAPYDNFNDY
jgi:hypothetical protein